MFTDTHNRQHTKRVHSSSLQENSHTLKCFTSRLSTFHNPKQDKEEEEAVPEPGTALCMLLQTCTPPGTAITLGSASQPTVAHLKCPETKPGGEGQ